MADWRAQPGSAAWDDNRRRILDAAARLADADGLVDLRVEPVAAAAGCSRATLYRYFDGKDALVCAVLADKAERLAGALAGQLTEVGDPADLIAEGILRSVDAVRRSGWFRASNDAGAAAKVARLGGGPQALALAIAPLMRPLIDSAAARGHGLRADITPAEAAEWLVLTVIGMITMRMPVRRSRPEQASFLRRFVAYTLLGPPRAARR